MDYLAEHGKPPSQKAVQRAHQEETGQMLNWESIKAAITDAATKVDTAAQPATQPQRNGVTTEM